VQALGKRLESLEGLTVRKEAHVAELGDRCETLELRIRSLEEEVEKRDDRIAVLEQRIQRMEVDTGDLASQVVMLEQGLCDDDEQAYRLLEAELIAADIGSYSSYPVIGNESVGADDPPS